MKVANGCFVLTMVDLSCESANYYPDTSLVAA